MDISSISAISSEYLKNYSSNIVSDEETESFSSIFDSMIQTLEETNDLHNKAESAEIQFALGESENTHDLLIAQTKATVALQYTVAVRDKLLDAYREIMQMQI
uniref:flagellar hook-basal body complex protein FliE n=1 Tax=Agathobacter sp. TaxID=2021311 RepID=UPI004056968F